MLSVGASWRVPASQADVLSENPGFAVLVERSGEGVKLSRACFATRLARQVDF
jgi:hypothetical protein